MNCRWSISPRATPGTNAVSLNINYRLKYVKYDIGIEFEGMIINTQFPV